MGLINETNAQYYAGQQAFTNSTSLGPYTWTGDTLLATSPRPNFKVLKNGTELTLTIDYNIDGNSITLVAAPITTDVIVIQLLEQSIWDNYGSYAYTSLIDIVNNFMVAYVGLDKIIPRAKRSDVIFHAKRGLSEFSFDTLKSIKSQELTVPPSLSVVIPQDYVNYVKLSWVDGLGVKHTIYPTQLTSSPSSAPIQDQAGNIVQDNFEENIDGTSVINERWQANDPSRITGLWPANTNNPTVYMYDWWGESTWGFGGFYGQRYGGDPVNMQVNGWFNIDPTMGTFNFSSDLANKLIMLEYISDGLAYDLDTKVPKMAEDAMYAHLNHAILSTRANTQEYIVQRYKQERFAKLRNAKIRLSNIKLDEIVQVMRNKSKWIKH